METLIRIGPLPAHPAAPEFARAPVSPYADWPEAYAEDRHRGLFQGVDLGVRLTGHPSIRGRTERPDLTTRPSGRRRPHVRA